MRFGIMAMQMDALLPTGGSPEEALAQASSFSHAGLVRRLHAAGFNLIELGGDLGMWFPHTYAPPAIQELAALRAGLSVSYTVHLPLWSVETSTPLEAVRNGSTQAVIDCIHATRVLEPEMYVLHATGALAAEFYQMRLPPTGKALILRQFQRNAMLSLQQILAETGLPSRQLAIETIEFPFELTLEMATSLDLSICLDSGHLLAGFSGDIDLFDALEQVLPRLGEVHLHDSPRPMPGDKPAYGQDHQPLGSGTLDLPRFFERLESAGFNGPVVFELTVPQALASLQTLRTVCPALFA